MVLHGGLLFLHAHRGVCPVYSPGDASPPSRIMKLWRRCVLRQPGHPCGFNYDKLGNLLAVADMNEVVCLAIIYILFPDQVLQIK